MAAVKDVRGNEWLIALSIAAIQRVLDFTGVDLFKVLEDKTILSKLFGDMVLQAKVLFAICDNQVRSKNMTIEEFQEQWDGDTLEAGLHEMFRTLGRFFPVGKREPLAAIVQTTQNFVNKMAEKQTALALSAPVDRIANSIETNARKEMETALEKMEGGTLSEPGSLSGSAAESSESSLGTSTETDVS